MAGAEGRVGDARALAEKLFNQHKEVLGALEAQNIAA
jgi:hypothetical protein